MSETELKFAKKAIAQVCKMCGESGTLLLQYIQLFSSKDAPLSLESTFEILLEVNEFWVTYPADVWQKAVNKLLAQQRSGSLHTPLTNHNVLIDEMELLADFERNDVVVASPPTYPATQLEPITQFPRPTPQQKAHAASQVQNMRSVLNQPSKYGKRP